MVKKHPTFTVDQDKPLATIYNEVGNIDERITEMDEAPSLSYMVRSGNVGSMANNQSKYVYLDDREEDDLHEQPDYSKVKDLDDVEKDVLVQDFITDKNNYEKKEPIKVDPPKVDDPKPTE